MLTPTEVDLLVEIGFWGLDERQFAEARDLFDLLSSVQSTNPYPRIGGAMVSWSQGRRDDAIERLEGVLHDYPKAVFTRSVLARFLKEAARPGWQQYARESLAMCSVGVSADMARAVLGMEADLKDYVSAQIPIAADRVSAPGGIRRA